MSLDKVVKKIFWKHLNCTNKQLLKEIFKLCQILVSSTSQKDDRAMMKSNTWKQHTGLDSHLLKIQSKKTLTIILELCTKMA